MKNYLVLALLCFWAAHGQEIKQETESDTSRTGKHFIVGQPAQAIEPVAADPAVIERSASMVVVDKKESTCALFAPDDNVRDALVKLIDNEKEAIAAAVFMITEKAIAHALVAAKKRGVDVQLIVDVGCLRDKASKIPLLSAHDCTIYLYDPIVGAPTKTNSLMHHKFALFKNNKGTPVVWTGSYNFTKAASESNRENVIIIRKKRIYDQYMHQFDLLKGRTYRYGRKTVIK